MGDLYFMATEICGYTRLSPEFHGDAQGVGMCVHLDRNDGKRKAAIFGPRSGYKTSTMTAFVLQQMMKNPAIQIFYIHHRIEDAKAVVAEAVNQIANNEKLREIWPPDHLPASNQKRWFSTETITLPRRRDYAKQHYPDLKIQHPTLSACSLGQNLTGSHPTLICMDDLVNLDSIQEQGNAEVIRTWAQGQLANIGTDARWRLVGTPWSDDDLHSDIMKPDSGWKVWLRAISEDPETHEPLLPEDGGIPAPILIPNLDGRGLHYLTKADVLERRRESRRFFGSQHMMVPDRAGRLIWRQDLCEHFVQWEDVEGIIRKVVVLSDPAPLGMGDKPRRDGEKDDWAYAVIGVATSQKRTVYILLDGKASPNWTPDAGLRRLRGAMWDWDTPLVGIEEPRGAGQKAQHFGRRLKALCRQEAMRCVPIQFKGGNIKKEYRIADLASAAECEDFWICEDTVNKHFLEKFLDQARNYAGEGSIPHDDCIDCVAFVLDQALLEFLPKPRMRVRDPNNPFQKRPGYTRKGRRFKYAPY